MFGLDVNQTKVGEAAPEAQRNLCVAGSGDAARPERRHRAGAVRRRQFRQPQPDRRQAHSTTLSSSPKAGESSASTPTAPSKKRSRGELPGRQVGARSPPIPTADLYAAIEGAAEVLKLKPSGRPPNGQSTSPLHAGDPAERPRALAIDGDDNLYVELGPQSREPERVQKYDPSGKCLTCGKEGEEGQAGLRPHLPASSQLAASRRARPAVRRRLRRSFQPRRSPQVLLQRLRRAPPDPDLCPQPGLGARGKGPVRASRWKRQAAELRADINPTLLERHHLPRRIRHLALSSKAAALHRRPQPDQRHGRRRRPATPSVFLEGLEPGTTYHYRFVAQSSGGGPAYGVDPDGPKARRSNFRSRPGRDLHHLPRRLPRRAVPANEAFRTRRLGAPARLPRLRDGLPARQSERATSCVLGSSAGLGCRRC